jgi:hypothetical protein
MKHYYISLIIFLKINLAFAQEGKLVRTDLFTIPTAKFEGASGYSFKVAVDSKENLAFNACSRSTVFIFNNKGEQVDSIELPFIKCVRNIEYSEDDNLLIMDNDEKNIYRYNTKYRKLESLPYSKPEDWYNLLNHYYRNFEIPTIPTYYSNNDYLQEFYSTRFTYSYNLFLNYKNGFIYQCHYNFLKKIDNHKSYVSLKKANYWLSDNISLKTKMLLVDDEHKTAVYYDRFYNLIYENFQTGLVTVNAALLPNSEAARFDYSVNKNQDKVFGISVFNKTAIHISSWKLP